MNSETMDKETLEGTAQPRPVLHILVIGFHHQRGAEVEFVYPKFQDGNLTKSLPAPWHPLLYVALPDGAHNYEADCIFFSLPSLKDDNTEQPGQVFGVACFQQIDSKDLKVKDNDVTRTSVQKSVVLIFKKPLFGFILSKLNLITQAYFNEKDFSQTTILKDTYTALNQTLSTSKLNVSMFYIDLSLGDLVIKLKQKVLLLIKLILMEKKVVFWGCPVGMVCTTMMSLLSLLPGFYNSGIFHDPDERKEPNEINEGSKDQYGLPLEIFGEECKLHPYISMQQMNSLKSDDSKGYVVGSSNLLFKHRTHLMWDALVDLEKNELVIPENDLNQSLSLTTEDLRFADFITSSVSEYRNNSGISWDGSDEWIRLQFKYYILCLLASTAPEKGNSSHIHKQFNEEFITNWKQTNNYKQWIEQKHLGLESIHQGIFLELEQLRT
eukprot:Seg3728.2 transcript_id=Seg3728.2/GoldUCD/mRNA.D3Y31 product="Late secretory pathway protein AVL9-like" protein_id=Seg3728.2/GoldUCD/D3Y31